MDYLPDELIIYILSLCDPNTLVKCRMVCRSLCKLIDESTLLQYHIELFGDGMVETYSSYCFSVAERLSLLRCRRAAWKELRWSQRPTPMIPGPWSAYELVDGIFSKTLDLSDDNSARGILFTTLPSKDYPGSLTKIDDVGIPFRDFAMDPTQDLIVFMQCSHASGSFTRMLVTLHFRTMSNNGPHPRALEPFTSVILTSIDIIGAVIQTVNDVVGLMAWGHNFSQLYVWDWTQCKLLVSEPRLHRLDDFAFISNRAYVLTSPNPEPCFRIYVFRNSHNASMPSAHPTLRATLRLPPMHDDASASQLGIHTGPYTTTSQTLQTGRPKPFMHDPDRRIHIISLELWGPLGPIDAPTSCLVVVHNRTFLAFTADDTDTETDINATSAPNLEWTMWGPSNTRWLPGRTGSSWLRYVHGERLVRLHPSTENGPHDLEVYDFGAPRGPRSSYSPDEDVSAIHSSVFTEPVIGHLPCHVVRKQGDFPYSGFMIDEERLIGLKRDFADQAESIDVFTF